MNSAKGTSPDNGPQYEGFSSLRGRVLSDEESARYINDRIEANYRWNSRWDHARSQITAVRGKFKKGLAADQDVIQQQQEIVRSKEDARKFREGVHFPVRRKQLSIGLGYSIPTPTPVEAGAKTEPDTGPSHEDMQTRGSTWCGHGSNAYEDANVSGPLPSPTISDSTPDTTPAFFHSHSDLSAYGADSGTLSTRSPRAHRLSTSLRWTLSTNHLWNDQNLCTMPPLRYLFQR